MLIFTGHPWNSKRSDEFDEYSSSLKIPTDWLSLRKDFHPAVFFTTELRKKIPSYSSLRSSVCNYRQEKIFIFLFSKLLIYLSYDVSHYSFDAGKREGCPKKSKTYRRLP